MSKSAKRSDSTKTDASLSNIQIKVILYFAVDWLGMDWCFLFAGWNGWINLFHKREVEAAHYIAHSMSFERNERQWRVVILSASWPTSFSNEWSKAIFFLPSLPFMELDVSFEGLWFCRLETVTPSGWLVLTLNRSMAVSLMVLECDSRNISYHAAGW